MSAITPTGFQLTSLVERYNSLITLVQSIWGPDVNIDPNSFDGQTLGIFAESHSNLESLAQLVYNCFNPNTASGNALSTLVQLNYLKRQNGAYSTVTLQFSGMPGVTVPKGSMFQSTDGSGTVWLTQDDALLDTGGTAYVQAQTQTYGSFTAPIGTVTKPLSPSYGLDSVNNPTAALPGQPEETDEQLRARRARSTAANGQGSVDSIRGALLQVGGVTAAEVYENYTQAADSNGQPGNSVYCVVVGGTEQQICDAIWFKRPMGIKPVGAVTGVVVDTAGWPHTMRFDRPSQTPVYIVANVKRRANFPATGDVIIKDALVAWAQKYLSIGNPVIQSELYAPLMAAINNTGSILSLYIGFAPAPATTADLTIAYNAIAEFDASLITVNLS